jgi:hypothetical protein
MTKIINGETIYLALADYLASNAYLNDTAKDVLVMVAKWIDEAPEVGKWIPVTERSPDEGQVLVLKKYKGKPYVDIGTIIEGRAYCASDEYAIHINEHRLTHWMPLPEPPKNDKEGTDAKEIN